MLPGIGADPRQHGGNCRSLVGKTQVGDSGGSASLTPRRTVPELELERAAETNGTVAQTRAFAGLRL